MTWAEIALAVLILGSFLASAVILPRRFRLLRTMEPPAGWEELAPDRKRAVTMALRHGEAIADPREAAIGLESADQTEWFLALFRPVNWIYAPLLTGFLVVGVLAPAWRFLAVVGAVGLASGAAVDLMIARYRRRLRAGVEATRARHRSR